MKKFYNFIFKSRHSAVTLFSVFAILMATRVYFASGKLLSDKFNEQMLHREQIVARVGASHVNDLLEDWGYDAVIFSSVISNEMNNKTGLQRDLEFIIGKYKNTSVIGAIVTDKNGIVLADANSEGVVDTGKDLSGREYFKWAKSASSGDVSFSEPLESKIGATKGNEIIVVTTPITSNNGGFLGVSAFAVDLNDFAARYLKPLQITEETRIYLIDKQGKLIYSQYRDLQGKNYFDSLNKIDFKGKEEAIDMLKKSLGSGYEGKIIVDLPNVEKNEIDRFLISHSPVMVHGEAKYVLAIATPIAQSNIFTIPIYANQFRVLVVFILIVIGFAIIEVTVTAIVTRKAYENGYRKGRS